MAGKYEVSINFSTTDGATLSSQIGSLVDQVRVNAKNKFKERASSTHRFTIYKLLDHDVRCANLLSEGVDTLNSLSSVRWALKLRGELMRLNYKPYDQQQSGVEISLERFLSLLNGIDWPQLIHYAAHSWKFRGKVLNEPVS